MIRHVLSLYQRCVLSDRLLGGSAHGLFRSFATPAFLAGAPGRTSRTEAHIDSNSSHQGRMRCADQHPHCERSTNRAARAGDRTNLERGRPAPFFALRRPPAPPRFPSDFLDLPPSAPLRTFEGLGRRFFLETGRLASRASATAASRAATARFTGHHAIRDESHRISPHSAPRQARIRTRARTHARQTFLCF